MSDRSIILSPIDQELKVASRALGRAYGNGEAMAALLGRRQQHYSDCGNPNVDTWLTIHDVAQLEDRTVGSAGHPPVTRALAARHGFALVRLPDALPGDVALLALMGKLAGESGDVTQALCTALTDSKIEDAELARIDTEIDHLIDVALRMKAAARAYAKGDR